MRAAELTVREASQADVQQLASIKPTACLHRDRIATAGSGSIRYLVVEAAPAVVGFAVLVLEQPDGWPGITPRPQLLDLMVAPGHRGRGIGTTLIAAAERFAMEAGRGEIFISVEPEANRRAFDLYRRLGYVPLQEHPRESRWAFVDSGGNAHSGVEWCIDLRKSLDQPGKHA